MPLIVPAEPTRDDVAAFRAYLDGIAPRLVVARYGARYLEHEPSAHRILSTIRRTLITALRLRQRHDEAQLLRTAQPGRLSPAAARRLDALLRQLPDLAVPTPALTDPVAPWFAPRSARSLAAAGITTLGAVAIRQLHRRTWWRTVPGLGLRGTQAIDAFFTSHVHLRDETRRLLREPRHSNFGLAGTAVIPWDWSNPPRELDGSRGKLRAPQRACLLEARNDYQAVQAWLSLQDSAATQRAYRKEAERLMLWAIIERGKPLSSLTTEEAIAYRQFLRHPTPVSRWMGPTAPRQSDEWRPFQKPLSARSTAYALSVLSALFRWLTEQRYLTGNPFAGITAKTLRNVRAGGETRTEFVTLSDRAFTTREWAFLVQWADRAATKLAWSTDAARRLQFVLRFAQATGLRISELVSARVRDIKIEQRSQRWLIVRGKGNKRALVALPPIAWRVLSDEMHRRGYGKRWNAWPSSLPLITAFATNEQEEVNEVKGVSSGRLWAILRKFFDQVADRIDTSKPQFATKLRSATPHWLRHTHASHALEGGADLTTVRDNLRHASLTTTSGYLHVDQARRSRQLGRAFGVALKKPRSIRPSV